jgi:hypothetical protein
VDVRTPASERPVRSPRGLSTSAEIVSRPPSSARARPPRPPSRHAVVADEAHRLDRARPAAAAGRTARRASAATAPCLVLQPSRGPTSTRRSHG